MANHQRSGPGQSTIIILRTLVTKDERVFDKLVIYSESVTYPNKQSVTVSNSPCAGTDSEHALFQSVQHAYCSQSERMSHHTPLLVYALDNGIAHFFFTLVEIYNCPL